MTDTTQPVQWPAGYRIHPRVEGPAKSIVDAVPRDARGGDW